MNKIGLCSDFGSHAPEVIKYWVLSAQLILVIAQKALCENASQNNANQPGMATSQVAAPLFITWENKSKGK